MNFDFDSYSPVETCVGCGKREPESGRLKIYEVLAGLQIRKIWVCQECMIKSIAIQSAICPLCHEMTKDVLTSTLRRGVGTVFHCPRCDLGFLIGEKREG